MALPISAVLCAMIAFEFVVVIFAPWEWRGPGLLLAIAPGWITAGFFILRRDGPWQLAMIVPLVLFIPALFLGDFLAHLVGVCLYD